MAWRLGSSSFLVAAALVSYAPPAAPQTSYRREPYNGSADARADIQAALMRAQADGKLVLVEFGANWCGPCWQMAALFDKPRVRAFLDQHFHLVTVDIGRFDRNRDLLRKYGLAMNSGIPAAVALAPNGEFIAVARGDIWANLETAGALLRHLTAWVERQPTERIALKGLPPTLHPTALEGWTDSLASKSGGAMGTFVVDVRPGGDSVFSALVSELDGKLAQVVYTTHDPGTLAPREVRAVMDGERVELAYSVDRVRGTRVTSDANTGPIVDTTRIDLAVEPGTIDRRNLTVVVPRLALEPGKAIRLPVFDSETMQTYAVKVACSKVGRVTMPDGQVEGYRLTLTGDLWNLPQTWYVTAAPPRRILRMEWPKATFESLR